jgi:putative transposase
MNESYLSSNLRKSPCTTLALPGHHRGAVGHQDQLEHRQRAQQEDLRPDRSLAVASHRGRASLRLPGCWIWLKRSWGGEVRNLSVLVAIGVAKDGFREVLGVAEGAKEDGESWRNFLRHLKDRGLKGIRLIVSDKCLGLVEALGECFPDARWQRCAVHFYRNVFTLVPKGKVKEVATMLKAIHAQEDRATALEKANAVVQKLEVMKLTRAAAVVREGAQETISYYAFPREHWRQIRTNNPLERVLREIRRRTRVVGSFPDGQSAVMLAAARLRHVAGTRWGSRQYMNMERLLQEENAKIAEAG